MTSFFGRFRPDRLAGQISILIIVALILFHATLTALHYLDGRLASLPSVGASVVGYILAMDVVPISERETLIVEAAKLAAPIRLEIRDAPPAASGRVA